SDGKLQRADIRTWIRSTIHRYFSHPLTVPPAGLKFPYSELRYDTFNKELLWFGPMTAEQRDDLLSKSDSKPYQEGINTFFRDSQSRQMEATFLFVGSQFYQDPETGRQIYLAEGGHALCVSNFADALIDIREESSASDGAQTFEAWTERIPPMNTQVILELIPKPSEKSGEKDESAEEKDSSGTTKQ
ncbi:MAG: hypothetical protein KDA85_17050, partial [Planctomycetaceae bacterium]|nr:hypothetical protein [Planctomycetaceae bacterium]